MPLLPFMLLWLIIAVVEAEEACSSEVFCWGEMLHVVQMAGLFADSKQFVDMPTRYPPHIIKERFMALGRKPTMESLEQFVADNFHPAGYDLRPHLPSDWHPDPAFLRDLVDAELREWAAIVHGKWRGLVRVWDPKRICRECDSSLLPLPMPFVVPGGRFREFYYWDTYWIIEGLLVSGMCGTAGHVIENLLFLVQKHGFVPNGTRAYYLNRSQPPMLPRMVARYSEECFANPGDFLKRALPLLEREHAFWMEYRSVTLPSPASGLHHRLNRYRADMDGARPESYREDWILSTPMDRLRGERGRRQLYRNLATAAESGWDFSGRWIQETSEDAGLDHTRTSDFVPVDLNSILLSNEVWWVIYGFN